MQTPSHYGPRLLHRCRLLVLSSQIWLHAMITLVIGEVSAAFCCSHSAPVLCLRCITCGTASCHRCLQPSVRTAQIRHLCIGVMPTSYILCCFIPWMLWLNLCGVENFDLDACVDPAWPLCAEFCSASLLIWSEIPATEKCSVRQINLGSSKQTLQVPANAMLTHTTLQ